MWIGIVSLLPEMFCAVTEHGLVSRAVAANRLQIDVANPRDFTHDKHHTVDDAPYGGGPGQVMMAEPIAQATEYLTNAVPSAPRRIYLTPEGRPLNQEVVESLVSHDALVLIAGHYEGIDERVRANLCDDEVSIGDYVLSGGELPAMVLIDALARRIPGVLGNAESLACESFTKGRLEGAHYTRPRIWRGEAVPDTLLSGDHKAVKSWRARSALKRTYERRPELFRARPLETHEITFIDDLQRGGDHAQEQGS